MALGAEQRKLYDDNGYLVVHNLLSPEQVKELGRRISEIVEAVSHDRGARVPGQATVELDAGGNPVAATATRAKPALRKLVNVAVDDPFFQSIAKLPQIVSIATELTQSDGRLKLYSDQVFLKPAFEGSEKPLHQDNAYFRVMPYHAGVTCWIAVDNATVENGCMRYMPGSHKLGLLKHKSLGGPHLTPDVDFKLPEEVAVPIPAGSAIFHHLLCCHSSGPNASPHSRRSWALHIANPAGESPVRKWEEMMDLA